MPIVSMLARIGRLLAPRAHAFPDLPDVILRELDGETLHTLEQRARRTDRPFSFRIHPISELTEYRDRLLIATFPAFGNNPH